MIRSLLIVLAVGLTAGPWRLSAAAQDWTRFRGPNGAGVAPAANIPVLWSEEDYNWQVRLPGKGHSSPVLWGEKIFLTAGEEKTGQQIALCLHADDGRVLWRRQFAEQTHRKHTLNSFASSTPTVDSERVYVCWTGPKQFLVAALDHSGEEKWRADLGVFRSGHGGGVSPIVLPQFDLVVVAGEHQGDGFLAALDRRTGKVRWRIERDSKLHYSTPCLFAFKEGPHKNEAPLLIFTNWKHGFTAVDPTRGTIAWQADVFDKRHIESSIASPIVAGDLVIGVCGWLGVRQEVAAIRPRQAAAAQSGLGQNKTPQKKTALAYVIDRGAPLCVTPLVKDDLLFLWSDEGIVSCADVATGEIHWRKRIGEKFYASPVCVGDQLYNISAGGKMVVLAAAKEFRRLGGASLGEPSHSTPAVAQGVMYIRTFSRLYSLGKPNSLGNKGR